MRFSCTCSGKCCTSHGDYEYVFVTRAEQRQLATHLELPFAEFRRRYTKRVGPMQRSLRFRLGKCILLKENQCSVYEVRPRQCRTWPFWPENMDPEVWRRDVASFCPGVGQGRLYRREEIEAVMENRAEVAKD